MANECRRVLVTGVVQGVGFRPFVYRIAHSRRIVGSVRNLGDAGVEILVEGPVDRIESFLVAISEEAPPLARIDGIQQTRIPLTGALEFSILPSIDEGSGAGQLPPDVATCDSCVEEILGNSRFHGYWATSCTDCGPRFTVIEALPYDRPRTSMVEFPMCEICRSEYTDPLERRYHAQTTACEACGPALEFDGDSHDAIDRSVHALLRGEIVAIKGIGGTHIACDATNQNAIGRLRMRLGRPNQPFAVMAPERMLDQFVDCSADERALMRQMHRPILVLRKKARMTLPGIAPGLHTIGVMLPYSGLHHLLFEKLGSPLAMTSANRPGQPMLIENERITERLRGISDHFLLHDRRIVARCDDSVQRHVAGKFVFLRRSRGVVPQGLDRNLGDQSILALGPESDLTFAVYDRGRVTLSQHIGTVDDLDTLGFLREAVEHLQGITRVRLPSVIACDLHPRFLTTQWARELAVLTGARVIPVQHHAAHLASVMIEHELESCVGIVMDGYGYGSDHGAWGGEVFVAEDRSVERVGSLWPVGLPGGDLAAKHPLRMAASLLFAASLSSDGIIAQLVERGMDPVTAQLVLRQLESGMNVPNTTSAGRFLDAVSAWLGLCSVRTYEGEPAMRLEAAASEGHAHRIEIPIIEHEGIARLDTVNLFATLVSMSKSASIHDVSATAQRALSEGIASLAVGIARERGISSVALSGGVGYNDAIASGIREYCQTKGIDFFTNRDVPCGDGGICLGQAAMAGLGITLTHGC